MRPFVLPLLLLAACAPPAEFRQLDDARVQQFIRGLSSGPLTE